VRGEKDEKRGREGKRGGGTVTFSQFCESKFYFRPLARERRRSRQLEVFDFCRPSIPYSGATSRGRLRQGGKREGGEGRGWRLEVYVFLWALRVTVRRLDHKLPEDESRDERKKKEGRRRGGKPDFLPPPFSDSLTVQSQSSAVKGGGGRGWERGRRKGKKGGEGVNFYYVPHSPMTVRGEKGT